MASYLSTATKGIFLTEQYEAEGLFMYDAVGAWLYEEGRPAPAIPEP